MSEEVFYFAYGSNMSARRMMERNVLFLSREHATLKNWRLLFNKKCIHGGCANIEPHQGSVVEGILYRIKKKDIQTLDVHEGYPDHYKRIEIEVQRDTGETVHAITYVAVPSKTSPGLRPTKKYLSYLLEGCDLLPREYCQRLREIETLDSE